MRLSVHIFCPVCVWVRCGKMMMMVMMNIELRRRTKLFLILIYELSLHTRSMCASDYRPTLQPPLLSDCHFGRMGESERVRERERERERERNVLNCVSLSENDLHAFFFSWFLLSPHARVSRFSFSPHFCNKVLFCKSVVSTVEQTQKVCECTRKLSTQVALG